MPKLFLPLFLLAAIGLTVYLAQQPTDITPSAQVVTEAPVGCEKLTPGKRFVRYKNCKSASEPCADQTNLVQSQNGEQDFKDDFKFDGQIVKDYPLKEKMREYGTWKLYGTQGPREVDGDRLTISSSRLDGPNGKSYKETDNDRLEGGGEKIEYGSGVFVEYAYSKVGTNNQGIESYLGEKSITFDASKSYVFAAKDPNSNTKCNGTSSGSKNTNESCNTQSECKSGVCTNKKCAAQGNKAGGATCTDGPECTSGTCSNGKCEGGTSTVGKACDENKDCASNKCENNKCVSATASASPSKSASPKASSTASTAPGASTTPGASTVASPSPTTSASPAASGTVPVSLTKAEITGFKNNYELLNARLGPASASGNLKVTATIAKNELTAIVSELPTCPDDSGVGPCLDSKFRTRFDFAKTAARLSAFYAIFNNISGICVKSDLGLNPLITATSVSNTLGRVNLCTEPTAARKLWRAFVGGQFIEIVATDTRWPANPTCATLPTDVLERYRRAEGLFSSQAGFTANTLCDGKTTVAPGN